MERTFPEALQKALRSLETGYQGLGADAAASRFDHLRPEEVLAALRVPTEDRLFLLERAVRLGIPLEQMHAATGIEAVK